MSFTLAFRVAQLQLILNGTALANVWDNAAVSPIANIYLSAHTADPGISGNQTTNEIAYGGYARYANARSALGFVVDPTTGIATLAGTILLATPTSGAGTISHIGLGRDAAGAGYLFGSGALDNAIIITVGVPPQLTTGSKIALG